MRTIRLIKGDLKFQLKYGFFGLYALLTVLYIILIQCIPEQYKQIVGSFVIITDPAALGLFFMGAIILLEKSQKILSSLAVSPIRVHEYIISKAVSIGILSTIVGGILGICAGVKNYLCMIFGIFLCSIIFTLLGLIVASIAKSLNQFLVFSVPVEIICFFPLILYYFNMNINWLKMHPLVSLVDTMLYDKNSFLVLIIESLIIIILLFFLCHRSISKNIFGRKQERI